MKSWNEIHTFQVADCLAIIGNLRNFLRGEDEIDKNVKISLESTIIRACNRLDALIDDAGRWQLPETNIQDVEAQKLNYINTLLGQDVTTREIQKQLAIGRLRYVPDPSDEMPPQPRRKRKK